jgi:hypothetical protein
VGSENYLSNTSFIEGLQCIHILFHHFPKFIRELNPPQKSVPIFSRIMSLVSEV